MVMDLCLLALIIGLLALIILQQSMIRHLGEMIDMLREMHEPRIAQLEDANEALQAYICRLDQPSGVPKQRRTMYPDQNR